MKNLEDDHKKSSILNNFLATAGIITVGSFTALFAAPVAATFLGGMAIAGAISVVSTALHVGNVLYAKNKSENI